MNFRPRPFYIQRLYQNTRPHQYQYRMKSTTLDNSSGASSRALSIRPSSDTTFTPPSFYRPTSSNPPHWRTVSSEGSFSSRPTPTSFISPWPSNNVGQNGFVSFFKARMFEWDEKPLPKKGQGLPVIRKAQWLPGPQEFATNPAPGALLYTWLGHAACHLQIPLSQDAASKSKPIKVLTDPVFSYRCSPVQFMGPKRYTDPPTSVSAMASEEEFERAWPDVILISHNHYDHLDFNTIKEFVNGGGLNRPCPSFVVPLGLKRWFTDNFKLDNGKIAEMDWWDQIELGTDTDDKSHGGALRITCTPAQHFSGRSGFDRDHTLWASYAIHVLPDSGSSSTLAPARIWFSGDTGYRSVPRGTDPKDETSLPHCPAFQEIGERLGPFDLSLIACGAYDPRSVMSPIHAAPHESVAIHQDVKSKKSFGIHHATFRLTPEDVDEPARKFIEEGQKAGLKDGEVNIVEIGETTEIHVPAAEAKEDDHSS